jgi:uncharacterized protein (DUF302 family)
MTLQRPLLLLCLAAFVAVGCGGDADDTSPIRQSPTGLVTAESSFGFAATVSRLDSVLQSKPPIGIVARIDHTANAASVGDSLRPTHVTLFGNPELGTPLIQRDPLAGLDLPQKMLVYETPDGRAMLLYHSIEYLVRRHGLEGVGTLPAMRQALQGLAAEITDSTVTPADSVTFDEGAGLIEVDSDATVDETVARLRAAVERTDGLSVMATLDHAANAERVGMDLPPTQLLVVGNPALGTPLMHDAPTLALDLPQKMLVYEDDDGTVRIAYNDPFFLADLHVLSGQEERLQSIADALAALAEQASSST